MKKKDSVMKSVLIVIIFIVIINGVYLLWYYNSSGNREQFLIDQLIGTIVESISAYIIGKIVKYYKSKQNKGSIR